MKKKIDGFFITFEGGEAVGKSTLLGRAAAFLRSKGYSVLETREPGGTTLGEEVRNVVLHQKIIITRKAELALYLASRAQHVEEVIIPALKEGKVVLSDRYNDSSLVYQGFARGLGLDEVEKVSLFFTNGLIPNLTFYFDLDPKLGLERTKSKIFDRIEAEKLSFHEKVREGFKLLVHKYPLRFKEVDASLPIDAVFSQIKVVLDGVL